jgi:hypothetical protein
MSKLLISKILTVVVFVSAIALATIIKAQTPIAVISPTTNVQSVAPQPSISSDSSSSVAPTTSNAPTVISGTTAKCGVNSFAVVNECGVGAFKNAKLQCYDGYQEKLGEETSCKSSDTWMQYAKEICVKRCGVIKEEPTTITKPSTPTISVVKPQPVSVCQISNSLTEEYNNLILELNKAESVGNTALAAEIKQKITTLKQKTIQNQKECASGSSTGSVQPTGATPITKPEIINKSVAVPINRCDEKIQWENKINAYKKLSALNDEQLKQESGFSRDEINKILNELASGLEKVKEQCLLQQKEPIYTIQISPETVTGGATASRPAIIAEPVKPVVVDSGQEITDYYKAKLEKISATATDTDAQINQLKVLRGEIDQLISNLIKSRKEIEASEFNNLATEVKVSGGEIKADNVSVSAAGKKILVDVNQTPISIEPTANQVILKDKNVSVETKEVSIQNGNLTLNGNEVKVTPSQIVEKIQVVPKAVELKTENEKAVYVIKADENRKLFGFIPIKVDKTVTADATNGEVIKQKLPWFSFLTTKSK